MVTYSKNHKLQESDKFYKTGEPAPAGHWEIIRYHRLVNEEGWRDWQTCAQAIAIEELPDILKDVKSALIAIGYVDDTIVLHNDPASVDWQQITEYFRMRMQEGDI